MKLQKEEQEVLETLCSQPKMLEVIEKFFIRPFENLPNDLRAMPDQELGQQVKAQMTARALNHAYFHELKVTGTKKGEGNSPIAPS